MAIKNGPRPKVLSFLIILLVLLGVGGFGGGTAMFIDPSGESMGLAPGLLDGLPISSYILPGMFLAVMMGLAPFVIAWGLWKGRPWAWGASVAESVFLILWICFQILLWGTPIVLQVMCLLWGLLMLGICFLPGLKSNREGSH